MKQNFLRFLESSWSGRCGIVIFVLVLILWTACSTDDDDTDQSLSADSNTDTREGMEFFHGSFEDALVLASEENKMVFVDVWTTWCGPCIVMQETVFPLPEVGEYFNARFINYKLDAENEDQNGPEISTRYEIELLPTYLILDSEGNELSRATGSVAPNQFISMVDRMLGEADSKFAEMRARYIAGERSTEFIQQYLMDSIVERTLRHSADVQKPDNEETNPNEADNYREIANEYFASRPHAELINETDARLVLHFRFSKPRGDELVEFVVDNFDRFLAVSSNAAVSQFVLDATLGAVSDAAHAGDVKYLEYLADLEEQPLKKAVDYERNRDPGSRLLPERIKYSWEADFLIAREDWDGLYELYQSRFEKWGDNATAGNYNWAAKRLIQSDNPSHRKEAVGYAKRACEMDDSDIWVVVGYIEALVTVENSNEARKIAQEYRSGLSDSGVDQQKLEILNEWTSALLDDSDAETSQSEN